jgi:hypothetical protein
MISKLPELFRMATATRAVLPLWLSAVIASLDALPAVIEPVLVN